MRTSLVFAVLAALLLSSEALFLKKKLALGIGAALGVGLVGGLLAAKHHKGYGYGGYYGGHGHGSYYGGYGKGHYFSGYGKGHYYPSYSYGYSGYDGGWSPYSDGYYGGW
ncbi:keratin-associated protein 19-2 [Galendromus occidentalis]|uniref:Keratin-associated protein 19-2 n=1 Tax=Galendromus occidentalis TaxID=34638 RepID=A0AAJ6QRJ6_9ACAR|nr:keratin-associated protein 19-2 [Galendromus occidentalis]